MTAKQAKRAALKSVRRHVGSAKKEQLFEQNPEALVLGDTPEDELYDDALIGMIQKPCGPIVACYDYEECVQCLVRNGNSYEDAIDWMASNVTCAYVGENGPVFFNKFNM